MEIGEELKSREIQRRLRKWKKIDVGFNTVIRNLRQLRKAKFISMTKNKYNHGTYVRLK